MTTLKPFVLFLFLVTSTHAQTSILPEVHVKLTLAEPKNVYKIGEPIRLILEFTADREGYVAEVLPDGKEQATDTVVISPVLGVTHWLDEMTGRFRIPGTLFPQQSCPTSRGVSSSYSTIL